MEFGIFDHMDHSNANTREHFETRLKLASVYDEAGFYAYHVAEHHGTPLGLASSPGIFLAALAQRTQRLRFGPLVYLLPLYHPLRLYEEICMLDQMSGGRLELGVGRGISPYELGFFELDPAEAQARFKEALEFILKACASDPFHFAGKYYSCRNMPLQLKPLQTPHPPLWYGAIKPDTAEWAAKQGMNIVCGNGPVGEVRAIVDRYRETWSESEHRHRPEPKLGLMRQLVIADTDEEARRIAKRSFRVFRRSFAYLWELNQDPLANMLLPDDFDAVQEHGEALAGSPETVRRVLIEQARASGANYFVCRFAFGDLSLGEILQSIKLFTTQVMPAMRQSAQRDRAA